MSFDVPRLADEQIRALTYLGEMPSAETKQEINYHYGLTTAPNHDTIGK